MEASYTKYKEVVLELRTEQGFPLVDFDGNSCRKSGSGIDFLEIRVD